MKILHKKIIKNGSGKIKLECETSEDFWHVYNLIRIGDTITSSTIRKITHTSNTGSTKQEKKKITVSIEIDTIDYDTSTAECSIRVKGKNIKENKYISMGQSHTINLSIGRSFTIEKRKWDTIDLSRIQMATNYSKSADTVIIVMEYGLAHMILVTEHMTIVQAKIEKSIPRKRIGSSSRHDKGIQRFYQMLMDSILRHINFSIVRCIILASPAFIKDDFYEYLMKEANAQSVKNVEYKHILHNKQCFIRGHCSSGHKSAVNEILSDPEMKKKMLSTKSILQTEILDKFFKYLNNPQKEAQAVYGEFHVQFANESQAIETLMITDNLFRSQNVKQREKFVKLVESCKENGANVHIFSSLHVSGEQLAQITGVAALLRWPMPELLELEFGEGEKKEENEENSNYNSNGIYDECNDDINNVQIPQKKYV